jgi:hypothetical protein
MHTPPISRRLVLLAPAAFLLPFAVHGETVRGNGTMRSQQRNVAGFTGVSVALAANVELSMGSTEGLQIEADENLLPLIETVVKDGTLEIRPVRNNLNLESRSIKVSVQAKKIEHLSIAASGSISADTLQSPRLDLDIGGSGSIAIREVRADKLGSAIGGSGSVKLGGGAAKSFSVAIGGSGNVEASGLQADAVDVSIGGSGDAKVWAQKSLRVAVAGSGNVQYWGDPAVSSTVVGSGRPRRMGPSPR